MDGTTIAEVEQLLLKLAVIAEQLEARSRGAVQHMEAGATALDRTAQHLTGGAGAFARQALDAIGAQARDSIADGTRQALARLDMQLRQSGDTAKWAAEALAEQRKLLTAAQRGLLRSGLLALLTGSLLAAGGSGYVAWRSLQTAAFSDQVLRAMRSGALVRCDDSQALCVRIGTHPRRSSRGNYLIVHSWEPGTTPNPRSSRAVSNNGRPITPE